MRSFFLILLAGICLGISAGAGEAIVFKLSLSNLMLGLMPILAFAISLFVPHVDIKEMEKIAFFGTVILIFGEMIGSALYQNTIRLLFSNSNLLVAGVANVGALVLIIIVFYLAVEQKAGHASSLRSFRISTLCLLLSGVFLGISLHSSLDVGWFWVSLPVLFLGICAYCVFPFVFSILFLRGLSKKHEGFLLDVNGWFLMFSIAAASGAVFSHLLVCSVWPWAFARPLFTLGHALFFGTLWLVLTWREHRQNRTESW